MDRFSIEEIIRVGLQKNLPVKVENCVLRWFRHLERMGDERMTKRVYDSELQARRGRGDQRESGPME